MVSSKRLEKIYHELKDVLALSRAANSAGVMMRVFLELSLDDFLVREQVMTKPKVESLRTSLNNKIQAAADHFEQHLGWSEHELKFVRGMTDMRSYPNSVDALHSYVHNRTMIPVAGDLITLWDNLQPFFEELWKP